MTPATPHRNTTRGTRSRNPDRKGAVWPGAALLTVAGGVVAGLVLALAWRDNIPATARGHGPVDGSFVERRAGRPRNLPRLSDRKSVGPSRAAAAGERAARSEHYLVMEVVADLRRVSRVGPAAKDEIDEQTGRLRTLLTPANAAQVARALSSQELATPIGTTVLEAWLAGDSDAASAWIAAQPGTTEHHAWLVAEALTQQPEKWVALYETLGTDSWTQAFLDYSSRELLRSNPGAAVSVAESLTPGERQTHLFETIAGDWMVRDPDAARAWINRVDDPVLRQRLVAVGAPSYASINPLGALEWLLAQSPGNTVPQEPLRTIAGIWRHTANPATVAWLNDLLAGTDVRSGPGLRPQ